MTNGKRIKEQLKDIHILRTKNFFLDKFLLVYS